jgi:peptidoglycan lytic transglycosylase
MKKLALGAYLLSLLMLPVQADWTSDVGEASYYHDRFQGRPTASGELYQNTELTAAHRTLAFGTLIRVTRLDTEESVVVRVNDRGPHKAGRVVDLSRRAAEEIGLVRAGIADVRIELFDPTSSDLETEFETPQDFTGPTGSGTLSDL